MDNKLLLIEWVKERPVLYDPLLPGYNDVKLKQELWTKAGKEFNEMPSKLRTTWNNLKCSYIRVLKKKILGDTLAKKWQYEDDLEFLYPSIEEKIRTNDDGSDFELLELDSDSTSDSDGVLIPEELDLDDNGASNFDERALIRAVKNHPWLYGFDNKDFKSIENAWKEVAKHMNDTVSNCQKRWEILIKQYGISLKRQQENGNKRLRWKFCKEMEFTKAFIEATFNKFKGAKRYPASTMEFFVSMATIVKKLPQGEQEAIEALILDMITEAELECQKDTYDVNKDTVDQLNSKVHDDRIVVDENEFLQRVKCKTEVGEVVQIENMTDASSMSCFTQETSSIDNVAITPTEQYVVKVIPEEESSEIQEEYIINVLPDSAEMNEDEVKTEIKEEVEIKDELEIKEEPDIKDEPAEIKNEPEEREGVEEECET